MIRSHSHSRIRWCTIYFDRRISASKKKEKKKWKNLSCHSNPEKEKEKRVAARPMSLPNGNEQRFENRPGQRAAEYI